MIPLHCLWAKSNRTRGQFECYVTLFLFSFCFDFVHSHRRCDCCSIVCLRFEDVQIKQVDFKMSTKNVNNYKQKTFRDIFRHLHIQEYKAMKEQIVRLQLKLASSASFCCKRKRKRGFQFFKIALRTRLSSPKWKEVNGKTDKSKEFLLKRKDDLKERPDNI